MQKRTTKRVSSKEKRIQKAIASLKECQLSNDTESAHAAADAVLMGLLKELGYEIVVEEYDKVDKWFA